MLRKALEECHAFFLEEDEESKRALTEVAGGDRLRKGAGYRDAGDGREQYHMGNYAKSCQKSMQKSVQSLWKVCAKSA